MKKVMFSDKVEIKEYNIDEPILIKENTLFNNKLVLFFTIFTFLFLFIFLF